MNISVHYKCIQDRNFSLHIPVVINTKDLNIVYLRRYYYRVIYNNYDIFMTRTINPVTCWLQASAEMVCKTSLTE